MNGKSTRIGVYKCYSCRKPFRVTVGTIFEKSHIPLHKWLQAILLMCASKKGFSSRQLARTLDFTPTSAWFLSMRVREAMREGKLLPAMGMGGGIVEIDETYTGWKKDYPKPLGHTHKFAVLTLIDRTHRQARSFHLDRADTSTIIPVVRENISKEATVATDRARYYTQLKKHVGRHESVNHRADEWARGEIHTNTVEGYFSVFKRGMRGTYQHCSERHLHRYLAEFDFRYNSRSALGVEDLERAEKALRGVSGKRLTYRKAHSGSAQQEGAQG
jgi:transposase-like protein